MYKSGNNCYLLPCPEGKIVDSGTFEELEKKHSEGNLEDIFLKVTGSEDLDPTVNSLAESMRE